jgi:hypothetical protein
MDAESPQRGRAADAAKLLAGLADVGLEQAEKVLRGMRGALRRNDYADLAADTRTDLLARGEVLLNRLTPAPESHMEALARIARQTRDLPDAP